MQSIFFTRHGESESNAAGLVAGQTDTPLTENGIAQAHEAAQWATDQGMHFDVIVSSPLIRSLLTAKIIARKFHYSVEAIKINHDLAERNCGDFEGRSIDDYHEMPESISVLEHGVESLEALHQRASDALEWLKNTYPEKTILMVSHSGIGKMFRIVAEGRDASEFDKTVSIPNATIIRLI